MSITSLISNKMYYTIIGQSNLLESQKNDFIKAKLMSPSKTWISLSSIVSKYV